MLKGHALGGIEGFGGLEQANHANLNEFLQVHEGHEAHPQVQGDSLDQPKVVVDESLDLMLSLLIGLKAGAGWHWFSS